MQRCVPDDWIICISQIDATAEIVYMGAVLDGYVVRAWISFIIDSVVIATVVAIDAVTIAVQCDAVFPLQVDAVACSG